VNISKKVLKGTENKKKSKKAISPKVWIVTSIILAVVLIAAILFDSLYEKTLITINGDKYRLNDLRYYFYTVESRYDAIDQIYGGQYWDMAYNESGTVTTRSVAMEEVINTIIGNEILYREAIAKGYALTSEESDTISDDVISFLYEGNVPEEVIDKNGFTGDYLTEIFTKLQLAKRCKEDVIEGLPVDDEAIKAEYKYEDYRQYDIEYLYISTQTTDDEGNKVSVDETAKKAAYDKISAKYQEALTAEDWSQLIPEDEKELTYKKDDFIARDAATTDEYGLSADLKAMIITMDNDDVSDIFEDEKGYYLVRMINNNSSESYDSTIENAIKTAEEEAFTAEFQENILPKYDYDIKERNLRNLRMGSITLAD
jgi:foldase protein PrsA